MAKLKLQSSKKKINKKKQELEAPDEVLTHLQRLSEHLNKHFKLYLGGLAAVIVVTLAVTWFMDSRTKKEIAASNSVTDAAAVMNAPVQTDAAEGIAEAPAPHKTEADRWTAASEKVKAALEGTDDELKAVAHGLDARVKMGLGQYGDAAKAYGEALSADPEGSLKPLYIENQGHAAAAAGDLSAAAGHFEKLAGSSNLYYRVRGQVLLGDLYNPNFGGDKGADVSKAKSHYEEALKALTPSSEQQILSETLRNLRGEIRRRQALLQG